MHRRSNYEIMKIQIEQKVNEIINLRTGEPLKKMPTAAASNTTSCATNSSNSFFTVTMRKNK